jgi:hypothetical protein
VEVDRASRITSSTTATGSFWYPGSSGATSAPIADEPRSLGAQREGRERERREGLTEPDVIPAAGAEVLPRLEVDHDPGGDAVRRRGAAKRAVLELVEHLAMLRADARDVHESQSSTKTRKGRPPRPTGP